MSIYDPIAEALSVTPIEFKFNISEHLSPDREIIPSPMKGLHQTDYAKSLLSAATKKQWADGNTNIDISKMRAGFTKKYGVDSINDIKATCPKCKKQGQWVAMKRWHFDNCRN